MLVHNLLLRRRSTGLLVVRLRSGRADFRRSGKNVIRQQSREVARIERGPGEFAKRGGIRGLDGRARGDVGGDLLGLVFLLALLGCCGLFAETGLAFLALALGFVVLPVRLSASWNRVRIKPRVVLTSRWPSRSPLQRHELVRVRYWLLPPQEHRHRYLPPQTMTKESLVSEVQEQVRA